MLQINTTKAGLISMQVLLDRKAELSPVESREAFLSQAVILMSSKVSTPPPQSPQSPQSPNPNHLPVVTLQPVSNNHSTNANTNGHIMAPTNGHSSSQNDTNSPTREPFGTHNGVTYIPEKQASSRINSLESIVEISVHTPTLVQSGHVVYAITYKVHEEEKAHGISQCIDS